MKWIAPDQFKFSAFEGLLTHPGQTLKDAYLPNGMATGLDARLARNSYFRSWPFSPSFSGFRGASTINPLSPRLCRRRCPPKPWSWITSVLKM